MSRSLSQPPGAAKGAKRHRFAHRPKRISRRAERDQFALLLVPVVWLLGLLGFAGVIFSALHYLVVGEANWSVYLLTAVPLVSALILALFRFVRGHFSPSLNEP
jgi:ABC-type multidrug transport system fused ATPase/permease subunit